MMELNNSDLILGTLLRIESLLRGDDKKSKPTSMGDIIHEAVSMHIGSDGEYDGILIRTLDIQFVLALNDWYRDKVPFARTKEINDGWRLPTDKEVMVMHIYKKEINALLSRFGSTISETESDNGVYYWIQSTTNCYRYMNIGRMEYPYETISKDYRFYVRCVRDVHYSVEVDKEETSGYTNN